MPDLSDTQKAVLAILPKVSSVLSICGSTAILAECFYFEPKRLGRAYNRLLCTMAVFDIIESVWNFGSTWIMPEDSGAKYALGNDDSCTAQGFFLQLGLTSPVLNAFLSWYYLLVIYYSWSEKRIKEKAEPWIYSISLLLGFGTSIAGVPLNLYHPSGLWCWIAPDGKPDTNNFNLYRYIFYFGPLFTCFAVITVNMGCIILYVRRLENVSKKYLVSTYASKLINARATKTQEDTKKKTEADKRAHSPPTRRSTIRRRKSLSLMPKDWITKGSAATHHLYEVKEVNECSEEIHSNVEVSTIENGMKSQIKLDTNDSTSMANEHDDIDAVISLFNVKDAPRESYIETNEAKSLPSCNRSVDEGIHNTENNQDATSFRQSLKMHDEQNELYAVPDKCIAGSSMRSETTSPLHEMLPQNNDVEAGTNAASQYCSLNSQSTLLIRNTETTIESNLSKTIDENKPSQTENKKMHSNQDVTRNSRSNDDTMNMSPIVQKSIVHISKFSIGEPETLASMVEKKEIRPSTLELRWFRNMFRKFGTKARIPNVYHRPPQNTPNQKNQVSRKTQKKTKTSLVTEQALFYVLSFILTFMWSIVNRFFAFAETPAPYWIKAGNAFFDPLQGFINFLVYIRPKLNSYRKRHQNLTMLQCVRALITHTEVGRDADKEAEEGAKRELYRWRKMKKKLKESAEEGHRVSGRLLNSSVHSSAVERPLEAKENDQKKVAENVVNEWKAVAMK